MTFRPGESGNPAGKKPGTLNKRTRVAVALDEAAEDVTKAVIDAAKAGDVAAARLVLERVKPPLRPQADRIEFDLDPAAPLTTQAQQVMASIASGAIDPDTGAMLINVLHGFAGLRQADELVARIEAMEAAARGGADQHPSRVVRTPS